MTNLRELLLQEQQRMEKILQKSTDQLKEAPEGSLYISSAGTYSQYYKHMPGNKENKKYIPKNNEELVRQLAQKSYDEKIARLAEKRLLQIQKITKDYEEEEIEKIFLKEHIERRKRIKPVEPTWNQLLNEWMSRPYTGKEFREDIPAILTERGERVRSKSEKILADYFYHNGIPYKYECPLYLNHFGTVYPDFTLLSKKTRQEIYWEHDGRMDDPVYAQKAVKKIQAYEKNNIYHGERLILTFETEQTILDSKIIEKHVKRLLL